MKVILIAGLFLYLTFSCQAENSTYTNKYDEMNLDEVLSSERLLNGYVKCLLDLGPCTPDGKELKKNLPDAIQNDCKKCTRRQREGSDKVMHHLIDNRPKDWEELEKKYKSDGSYRAKYLESKRKNTSLEKSYLSSEKTAEDKI